MRRQLELQLVRDVLEQWLQKMEIACAMWALEEGKQALDILHLVDVLVVLAVAFSWEANALSRGAQDADLAEERSQDTSNYNDGCSDCK